MGKGGGKQHTPYEAPNDLTSRQKLSVIDLVSEGPIEGPVEDLKGVYLNNTPVIDSSGNSNVNGMTAQWVSGTLEQPALEGFSSSSSETPVGIEIKKSTPVTRTITSRNIDRLRLTFGTQALVEIKDNGDRVGTSVELQVQIQRNGQWITEKNVTIRGKRSNSPYLMAVVIDNLPPPPFSIRMVRITVDSTSDSLQNNTMWSSYTEITDINQTYPGSAVAGLTFESEQFGNQYPTRNYLVRGLIVQVPSNYDPEARTYSGIWDGTFKPAYTNNPAWVLYCLLTTTRFGLGKRLKVSEVDKFALYVIGQYCDQLVPDGFGNKEPRVTCNAYITDIRKAYDYFSDLCSMMRIMPVWNGLQMTFIQDRPSDVVWIYTNANVVSGRFNYSFSPLKARHTVIEVRFIDPQNGWKTSVEQVSDDALVAQFGLNVLKVDAFGCTSRGQARRHGLWILLTEKLETQTVEFDIGAEGLRHTPGDIIEIMDNDWVGGEDPVGGRLIAIDGLQKVLTLDREVTKPKSGTAFITLMNGTGKYERVKVTGYLANNQIKVESVPKGIEAKTVWGITKPDLARRLFRAITISDKSDGTYGVLAVQHIPEKEAIVDQGIKFEPLPDTPLGGYIPPIENLSVEVSPDSDSWQVEANWSTTTATRGVDFILKLTQAGRIVGTAKTEENRYRIGNLPQGNYLLSVAPQNKDGQKGEQASVSFDINPPPLPSYIDVEPGFFSLGIIPHVSGQNALRLQYEFWFSEKQIANINEIELLAEYLGNGTMWVIQGRKLKAGQTYYVYVRTVNPVGKSQFVEASGKPEDKADEILEFLGDKFLSTEAGQHFQDQIDFNQNNVTLQLEQAAEATLNNTIMLNQVSFRLFEEEGSRKAEIFRLEQVRISDNEALARWQQQVSTDYEQTSSAVLKVQESISTLEESTAKDISQVKAEIKQVDDKLGNIDARITDQSEAIATIDETQTKHIETAESRFGDNEALINQLARSIANAESSLAEMGMQLSAEFGNQANEQLRIKASITRLDTVTADKFQAFAQSFEQISTQFNDVNSSITTLKKSVSDNEKAQAETNELIKSEIGDNKAAIELRGQTVFDHKGNGSAVYTIKTGINWNGGYYDAKFMMGAEVKNGKVVTQIGFSADTFGIFNPASGKLEPVFFVENGQVFINEAFINQATIEKLLIGSTIKSKNWDLAAKKGLMLDFEKGKIIANDADITGNINATSGAFSNVTIAENCDVKGTIYTENLKGNIVSVTKDIYINRSWQGAQVIELFKVAKRSQSCHVWIQGALNPNESIPTHQGVATPNRAVIAYRAPRKTDITGFCDIYVDNVKQPKPNTYSIEGTLTSDVYALNEFVVDVPSGKGYASVGISIPHNGGEWTRFIMRARIIVFPSTDEVIL